MESRRVGHSPVSLVSWYRVQFRDCDPNGHANNAVLVGMLEQAGMDYLALGGFSARQTRAEHDAVFVTRRYEVTFHQSAFENDVLVVHAQLAEMGGAKAVADYELRRVQHDCYALPPADLDVGLGDNPFPHSDLLVSARSVYAFTSLTRRRPVRIPQRIVDTFYPPVEQLARLVLVAD